MAGQAPKTPERPRPLPALLARSAIGGVLMGLANLVPGISGGTMLLAAGVYPPFIRAIAEVTTARFRFQSVVLLGSIGAAALLAILLLAGTMRTWVIEERWIMYSLFIGLTLGGLPLVWKLARPATPGLWLGAAIGFGLMLLMTVGLGDGSRSAEANWIFLLLSGLAGASAMILPGISGGYLLLLLGQYETILGAIDVVKEGLLGPGGPSLTLLLEAAGVVVPVGVGVIVGIVGVSNALKFLLERYEKPTLGTLLGLLLGAIVGLWPFQEPVEPHLGDVVKGLVITTDNRQEIDPEDWPLEYFSPRGVQVATSLALILAGFGATLGIARIGGDAPETGQEPARG